MKKYIFLIFTVLFTVSVQAQDNVSEQSAITNEGDVCSKLFNKTVLAYQELYKKLPAQSLVPAQSPLLALLHLQIADCNLPSTLSVIDKALGSHARKMAILIPFSKLPKSAGQILIRGVYSWLQSIGIDPRQLLIWRDTEGQVTQLESHLAQLVWIHNSSLLVGGHTQSEARLLARWSDRLKIPALILHRRPPGPTSKYVFYVNPDTKLLASSLSRFALNRKLNRIAIFQPQYSSDQNLVTEFQAQAEQLHLQVTGPLIYNPADFSSIDGLVRKLFHIDDESRNQELLDLMNKAKETAEQMGVPFNAKNLVLPPQIDIDAILIADHFKNLRHLSKILAYYGVKQVQLMGIPKWRAAELVDPPDENLRGAVFVDYIGSYKQMPYAIEVGTVDQEFFAEATQAGITDLRLVLHHALYAGLQALKEQNIPRYALYKKLEQASGPAQSFMSAPKIFRPDHSTHWPSFLFGVSQGSLNLLQSWAPWKNSAQARSTP